LEYEKAIALDPDFGPALNMLGYANVSTGEFEKAEAAFKRYIAANPGDPNPIDSLAELYVHMGNLDKAEARYREALDARPDFLGSRGGLVYIAALRENYGEVTRRLEELVAQANPTEKMEWLWYANFIDYFLGRLEKSLAGYLALKKICESYGAAIIAAGVERISGFIYCDLGRFDEARKAFRASFEYSRQGEPTGQNIVSAHYAWRLGWVDLKQGRLEDARARLDEIKSLFPPSSELEDSDDLSFRYQLLEAEVALAGDSREKAVAVAGKVRLENFTGVGTVEMNSYNTPFCKDVLARAYWKKGELDKAAAEYRKLTTVDPSNRFRSFIHPLYHYRLGRILEEKADKAGAADEYRKFLEGWKDADKTHPELADARKRLAALDSNPR